MTNMYRDWDLEDKTRIYKKDSEESQMTFKDLYPVFQQEWTYQ